MGKDLAAMSDRERSLLRRTRIGFIFQFFNLLPTLTAAENVALPLLLGGKARSAALSKQALSLGARRHGPPRASIFPRRCPAARCSAWPSPAPWSPSRKPSSATSRPATSTRPTATRSSSCCAACPNRASASVVMVTHDKSAAAYGDRLVTIRDGLLSGEVRNPRPELSVATG